MNIVVLTGSPHRNGTTSVLTEEFIKGAESKGHNVFRFDAAFHDIHPCQGCDACGMNGPCVQKDDIENDLIMRLVDADLIALISPVYYWHVSAQLKPASTASMRAPAASAASRVCCLRQQAAIWIGRWSA